MTLHQQSGWHFSAMGPKRKLEAHEQKIAQHVAETRLRPTVHGKWVLEYRVAKQEAK